MNIVKFKIIEFVRKWLAVTNATNKKLTKKMNEKSCDRCFLCMDIIASELCDVYEATQ